MRRRREAAGEELPQGDHPAETGSEENDMVPPRQKHMTPEMAAEIRAEAEKGDAESQSRLGDLYRFGAGVKSDIAEAIRWYSAAVEQGSGSGMARLGRCYELRSARSREGGGSLHQVR